MRKNITIDKAIKNLKAGRRDCGMIPEEEFLPTLNLAIEALKRVLLYRKGMYILGLGDKMRGETKEEKNARH